jgi:N-methylhydantoinase A
MTARYRLGVDIGGTFTDATLVDEMTGEIRIGKILSSPEDPSLSFLEATRRMLTREDVAPNQVATVVHGTTVATNAIIEGKVAKTGFITTDGFRDMLEIARQTRPSPYDLRFEKPRSLVPRHRCFGVPERLDAHGRVLTPLDEAAVRRVAAEMRQDGVESVAVCFLHAYVNASHEERVREILREAFPEAVVSLSTEVAPEIREYLRASTVVINAGIRPIVSRYLEKIETRLREFGISAELLIMQSSGGVFTFSSARSKPVFIVESGPAAGVIAASHLGSTLGYGNVISYDMGGTTAKAGLIQNGIPRVTKDYEVGAAAGAGVGSQRGSGYPIRTPVIDLVEIGAGGGSIAWIDSGGMLRVGAESAGADPGPACYGLGGTRPTVTDANVVLGRLNPGYFLGGEIELDVERARDAIQTHCADPLGLEVVEVAHAIVEIANLAMVNALRLVSVQRGYDPREHVMIAFGGAGPVHANRLAAEVGVPLTLIPLSPGTTSAMGLLVTDLKHDYSVTHVRRIDRVDPTAVARAYRTIEEDGKAALIREGIPPEDVSFLRQVDVRYVGQSYELTMPLLGGAFESAEFARIAERFHHEHEQIYGYSAPDEPVELVNLRLTAIGTIAKPRLREVTPGGDAGVARKGTRAVYFAESGGYVDCPIYDRYLLSAGSVVAGPAIVEEFDSTSVIHPDYRALFDRFGNLLLSRGVTLPREEELVPSTARGVGLHHTHAG